MRFLPLMTALILAGCISGPEPQPTTTTSLPDAYTMESSQAMAIGYAVEAYPGNASACGKPRFEGVYPLSCDKCWEFTFLIDCKTQTMDSNRTELRRLNVPVNMGVIGQPNETVIGLTCNQDGDCIPGKPGFNIRYACLNGICGIGDFDDAASEYCRKTGNRLMMGRQSTGGSYIMCRFTNGNECEEWSYFYRRCDWDTGNLSDCSDYSSTQICTTEYNPVCARISSKDNGTETIYARDYANGCTACITTTLTDITVGYSIGPCQSTTTTLKESVILNAAAQYCEQKGYVYRMKRYPSGREYGVCVFGIEDECNADEFFKGICGPKHLGN
jgi:putative hemolysin